MFISKKKIKPSLRNCMSNEAGFREKNIMRNASCVSSSKNGRYITYTMKNPDYKKNRYETTKTFSSTFDTKLCKWVY